MSESFPNVISLHANTCARWPTLLSSFFANEDAEAQNLGDLFQVTQVGHCGARIWPSDFYCPVYRTSAHDTGAMAWAAVSSSDQFIHVPGHSCWLGRSDCDGRQGRGPGEGEG